MNHADLPLPERIATLPRDERGYPVPYIILWVDGKPVFTANDILKITQADSEHLCHICGQHLDEVVWFVGGPGSALLNGGVGVYQDGPLHHECLHFALMVCPHLLGRMTKALAPTIAKELIAKGRKNMTLVNTTRLPGVPEVFVAVGARRFEQRYSTYRVPRPYLKVEYWQRGAMVPAQEGEKTARRLARSLAASLRQ